jgi:hypothetical protein
MVNSEAPAANVPAQLDRYVSSAEAAALLVLMFGCWRTGAPRVGGRDTESSQSLSAIRFSI